MYLLAPAVLCVGISFLLYGATPVWPLGVHNLQGFSVHPVQAEDLKFLDKAVKSQQITPNQAEAAWQQKYREHSNVVKNVIVKSVMAQN